MKDKVTTLAEIKEYIQEFSNARGWRKDQNAKDVYKRQVRCRSNCSQNSLTERKTKADISKTFPRHT